MNKESPTRRLTTNQPNQQQVKRVGMKNGSEFVFFGGRYNGKTEFWGSWADCIKRREEGQRAILQAIFKLWPR